MTQQMEASFKLFRIDSNVFAYPGFAICTAFRNPGGYLKAESFVLTQLSDTEGALVGCKVSFSNNAGPDCLVVLDELFAMDEALRQAEVDYSIQMHNKNSASSSPMAWPQKNFNEIPPHRLVGVWAHTPLKDQLARVGDATDCDQLSNFLYSLRSLPTISHSQFAV